MGGFTFNPLTGELVPAGSGGGGGTDANSFATIQPPNGTSPTASSVADTLNETSSDSSITITGTAATKTIDYKLSSTLQTAISTNTSNIATKVSKTGDTMSGALVVTNSSGLTTGTATEIDTGSPNTKGLIVKGNTNVTAPSAANPNTISGLQLWLKADSLALSDGTSVSSWTDSSTNAYALSAAGAAQPIFKTNIVNGKPVVRFNGSSNAISAASVDLLGASNDFSFFIVAYVNSSQPATNDLFEYEPPSGRITMEQNGGTTGQYYPAFISTSGYQATTSYINMPVSAWGVAEAIKNGTSYSAWERGTSQFSALTVVNGLNRGAGPFFLGAQSASNRFFSGDIAEVIFYNRALTTLERNNIEQYIVNKYGVAISSGAVTTTQAANLQEWQDASGTVLAYVDPSGNVTAPNVTANTSNIALKAPIASPTFTGTATTPALNVSGLTASTVPYLDASKNLTSSAVTPTQLGYLDATSSVQTQLNAKAPIASPTFTGTATAPTFNGSGLTASKVLASDGSKNIVSTSIDSAQFLAVMDPTQGSMLFDDFISTASAGPPGWTIAATGTGATNVQSSVVNAAGRPGIWAMTPGTTATGTASMRQYTAGVVLGGGAWAMQTSVYLSALSTSTDEYVFRWGLGTNITQAADEAQGVWFEYDRLGQGANWVMCTADNGVRTRTATSTAVAATTWTKLRIEVNAAGTLATFYVNGSSVGTISTNLPVTASRACGEKFHMYATAYTSIQKFVYTDYHWRQTTFTSAR